jgi:hypothetical protein
MKKDAGLRLQELIDEFGGLDECTRHRVQEKKMIFVLSRHRISEEWHSC